MAAISCVRLGGLKAVIDPKRAVLLTYLIFCALAIFWAVESVRSTFNHTVAHARVETSNTARLLAEHALRTLEIADHVLHRVDDQVREVGIEALGRSGKEWRRFKSLEAELPEGGTVWVYDAEGRTVASSARFPAPSVSVTDRDYFRAHRDQNLPVAVGPAIRGRTTGRLVFTLSRRLDDGGGRFLGALVVALDVAHFTGFFDSLQPSPGVLFALLREDGTLLARLGLSDADLERSLAGSELMGHLSTGRVGFFDGSGPFDGEPRFFAYRHLENYPLVLVAGLSQEGVLATARRHAVETSILVAVALLLLGGLTAVALRGMRREAETRSVLETARENLEARVSERTDALSEANRRLALEVRERAWAEERLSESHHFIRAILDSISSHVAILDADGVILDTNEAWRRFAVENGFSGPLDGIGSNYLTVCDQSAAAGDEEAAAAAASIRAIRAGIALELVLTYSCHAPEEKRWFNLRVTRLRGSGPLRLVVSHEDVSNVKRVEEALRATEAELRSAIERAEAAARAKSDFLATMSHELRTPMNAIIGAVDTLKETTLTPDQESGVVLLDAAAEDLLAQINQLLDLSAIESGRITLDQSAFDLPRLIRQASDLFRPQAGKKGLTFDCVTTADLPSTLVGDAIRLRQVLVNLIGNAVKFTEAGGVTVTAERLAASGSAARGTLATIRITVADTGIGIAPAMQERIFERFTQVDSSITRRYGGTGLGLNIARHLVELMGGAIRFSSRPGAGSIFTVTLALPVAGDRPAVSPPESLPRAEGGGWRILLVEDSEYNRVVVQTYLKPLGCRIDEAEDGERAIAVFKDGHYDLVLMDVQMPLMDGYAATRAIRAWERLQGRAPTPILALTAHAYASDVDAALAAGCDAHLAKPVHRADLIAAVRHLAGRIPVERAPA